MKRIHSLGFLTLALAGSTAAMAQTSTTGAVVGIVKDGAGKPVAEATIQMASGQITRTTVTAADGSFRIPLLNAGKYQMTVTKRDFNTLNQKLDINLNETHKINLNLSPVSQAVVEVVASAPSMDSTSISTGSNLSAERIASLPTGRDFLDTLTLVPGVSKGETGTLISGGSGVENSYQIDGLETTDMRSGNKGASLPTQFIEQVEVQTGGFKPEYSALGGVIIAATKSGSNTFGFSFDVNDSPRNGYGHTKPLSALIIDTPHNERREYVATVSGPIVKDKLFYFVGLNRINETGANTVRTNQVYALDDSKETKDTDRGYAKLNWFLNADHQLTFVVQKDKQRDGQTDLWNNTVNYLSPHNWGGKTKNDNTNWNLNYDWTVTSNLAVTAKYGQVTNEGGFVPTMAGGPLVRDRMYYTWDGPGKGYLSNPIIPVGNSLFTGGYGPYEAQNKMTSKQAKVDVTWILGNHELKGGLSSIDSTFTKVDAQTGGRQWTIERTISNIPADATHPNGKKYTFDHIEEIISRQNGEAKAHYTAFYLQDSWQIQPGLRIFYGGRYEGQELKTDTGETFFKFTKVGKQLQPRFGFTWDVNNDGRSKISGSLAKYYEKIPLQPVMREGGSEYNATNYFNASTGKATYNLSTGAWSVNGTPDKTLSSSAAFSGAPKADGLKLPSRSEIQLGYERDFGHGLVGKVYGKYRKMQDGMEDSILTDANGLPADGSGFGNGGAVIWNPGSSSVSYVNQAGQRVTAGSTITSLFPEAKNFYKSLEFSLQKQGETYFLSANYTLSKAWGYYEGIAQESNGQADANITEAYDFWTMVTGGPLAQDRTHALKLQGSKTWNVFGNPLSLGLTWQYLSGTPRSVRDDGSLTNGMPIGWDSDGNHQVTLADGTIRVINNTPAALTALANPANTNAAGYWVGPMSLVHSYLALQVPYNYAGNQIYVNRTRGNAGRNPFYSNADLKLTYDISLKKFKIQPQLEVFNLFNRRSVQGWDNIASDKNGPNTTYGFVNSVQDGRYFRVGISTRF